MMTGRPPMTARKLWDVSTLSAEYVLIWMAWAWGVTLLWRIDLLTYPGYSAMTFVLAEPRLWVGMALAVGIVHAASIWADWSWLRQVALHGHVVLWGMIMTGFALAPGAAPTGVGVYGGLLIVSLWIIARGPSSE